MGAREPTLSVEVRDLRAKAGYVSLCLPEESANAKRRTDTVNCSKCTHIGDHDGIDRVGWCSLLRFRVSSWHDAECKVFEPA